jgi:RNA polymerase sigma-70 factor (ECF subfamily)
VTATAEFTDLTEPFRRELLTHCYRMLGSFEEAEDLVQETFLRAWRGFGDYEGRASLRTWLYRIATNACLTALEQRGRRPLPSGLAGPTEDPTGPLAPSRHDIPWLQPFPDDPATIVTSRSDIRLAFVAALQLLPARQRAALILKDVLDWPVPEIATLLNTSKAAVNSALQRARGTLDGVSPTSTVEPIPADRQSLLDRYVSAFELLDIDALTRLLADDVVWEMPPRPDWFTGSATVARLIAHRAGPNSRLLPTHANSQPAFAMYIPGPDGVLHPHSVQVLTLHAGKISYVVSFHTPTLFPHFNLPPTLPRYPLVDSTPR